MKNPMVFCLLACAIPASGCGCARAKTDVEKLTEVVEKLSEKVSKTDKDMADTRAAAEKAAADKAAIEKLKELIDADRKEREAREEKSKAKAKELDEALEKAKKREEEDKKTKDRLDELERWRKAVEDVKPKFGSPPPKFSMSRERESLSVQIKRLEIERDHELAKLYREWRVLCQEACLRSVKSYGFPTEKINVTDPVSGKVRLMFPPIAFTYLSKEVRLKRMDAKWAEIRHKRLDFDSQIEALKRNAAPPPSYAKLSPSFK